MSKAMPDLKERRFVAEGDTVKIAMNAEMFRDIFKLASTLISLEVQVMIKEDGLYVKQMDEANIAMTIMFVPRTLFMELKQGEKFSELRLPVDEVLSILTRLSTGDVVVFTVSDKGKLCVEIKGKRLRVFNLPLFEVEKIERRDPKVPFEARIKTSVEGLLEAIEDAKKLITRGTASKRKQITGMAKFNTEPMGLHIEAGTEDELYSMEAMLTSGWDIMKFEGKTGVEVGIAIEYIMKIAEAVSKVTNMVQLEMATHMPMHIIAELPFKGQLEYWVAPRIPVEREEVKGI